MTVVRWNSSQNSELQNNGCETFRLPQSTRGAQKRHCAVFAVSVTNETLRLLRFRFAHGVDDEVEQKLLVVTAAD